MPWRTAAATPLFALALLLGLAPAANAARLALVIGNEQYQVLGKLVNAAKDARDVATELRAAGFQVPDKWVVQNGTRDSMRAALQDFVGRLKPEDEVVFYYSGHGVEIDAQAALVPVDLRDPSRNPLDGSLRPLADVDLAKQQVLDDSVTLNRVAADIAGRGVRFSLLIVDACRDNPILELLKKAHANSPLKNAGAVPAAGLIADSMADSQVLLFSASKGQQSLDRLGRDDPEKNGVFTRVLLKAMRTPGLGLRDMLPQVKAEVKTLAATVRIGGRPHVQEPRTMAAYEAPNFHFRPQAAAPAVPAVARPAEPTVRVASADEVEQQLWDLIKDSRDIHDFKDYLQRYPNGRFVGLAARQVRVLSPPPVVAVAPASAPLPVPAQAAASAPVPAPVRVATAAPETARPVTPPPQDQAPARATPTVVKPGRQFKDCQNCPDMVVIPAGSFVMGSPPDEVGRTDDEGPQRSVNIPSFAAGKMEVTFAQWDACHAAGACTSRPDANWWGRGNQPVIRVSWNDTQEYVKWLSSITGQHYRLLTEAEWEYAARAGSTTAYPWGAELGGGHEVCKGCGSQWDDKRPAPVGSLAPNAFGLHDMIGNVCEWVQDEWHPDYTNAPVDGSARAKAGPVVWRVFRGGAFNSGAPWARSAKRARWLADNNNTSIIGFRVARTL